MTQRLAWSGSVGIALAMVLLLVGGCRRSGGKLEVERDWERWDGCTLIAGRYFDGDSFPIRHDGRTYVLRLYFVDAPETAMAYESQVREQAAYFGVSDKETIEAGVRAREFTAKFLAQPFRVFTRLDAAPGASRIERRYAIVERDGTRLDAALIEAGLARATAETAAFPDEESGHRHGNELRILEQKAAHQRKGLWAYSQRADRRESRGEGIKQRLGFKSPLHQVNVNTASRTDLEALPGVGPSGAAAIIRARPIRDLDALDALPGFGPKRIEGLRDLVRFD